MATLADEFLARVIRIDAVQRHRAAITDARELRFLDDGYLLGDYRNHHWPLAKRREPLSEFVLIEGPAPPVSSALQQAGAAATLAWDVDFIGALRSGGLVATGVNLDGARQAIAPEEWSFTARRYLDVQHSELIELRDGREFVLWQAIIVTQRTRAQKPGVVDWNEWWTHERERLRHGLLPGPRGYLREAEHLIKERYGVTVVPLSELRRLKVALYRGDLERPTSTKRGRRGSRPKTKSSKRTRR